MGAELFHADTQTDTTKLMSIKESCRNYIGPPNCKNVSEIATQLGPRQSNSKAPCLYIVILILFQAGWWTKSKQRMIQNQLQVSEI